MSSLRLFPPSRCLKPQSHRRDMPISAQHALVLRQCSCVISRLPRFQCPPGVQCAFASFHGQPRPFLSSSEATVFEGIGWTRPILPSRHRFSLYHRQAGLVSIEESSTPDAVPGERSWELTQTVELVALVALWYILNICFNIYNKQILKVYPFPMTISAFQFAIGSFLIFIMWICNLYKRPQISISQLAMILPLAIFHTLGNLFTNMSLGMVSVSFTHTIKAMEPFFTVIFSTMFLGELPTIWIISSLMPIVGGVALASFTEATFNWTGFWSAMASNATNQSRNVLSKKLMSEKEATLDNITLFSIITIMSFFLTLPVALCIEGIKFTPFYMQSTGLKDIFVRCFLVGFCFHAYQQVSYIILARVSPVTHSVSNCVKRVVVIVSSVLFFKTPVSALNSFGTAVALGGVFLYSKLKNVKPKGD